MGHCQGLGALHAGQQESGPGHLRFSLDTLCWVFFSPPPASPTYSQTCSLQTSAHPTSVPPSITSCLLVLISKREEDWPLR